MRTFLSVKLALLPLLAFWLLLSQGMAGIAIAAALCLSALGNAWNHWAGTHKALELATLGFLAALGIALLAGWSWPVDRAIVLSYLGLSVISLATAVVRKPWTADYARAAFPQAAASPTFALVNTVITATWGILFLLLAAARLAALSAWVTHTVVALGALFTIFGPKLIIRSALRRLIRRQQPYDWPAPALHRAGTDGFDVVVVGAGIGGLTAAALLADAGAKVVVAEQHTAPGGFCQSWHRAVAHNGAMRRFRFDSGVHDISGVRPGGPVTAILDRLKPGHQLTWIRLDQRYQLGGRTIDVAHDWQLHAARLAAMFPDSAHGIQSFFRDLRAIFEAMYATAASRGGIPGMPRTVDELLEFPRRHPLTVRWMHWPFADFVAEHVTAPAVQDAITMLAAYRGDRIADMTVAEMAPIFGYYFFGGHYPQGGSGRLAHVLVDAIRDRGGSVLLHSSVERIVVENRKACGLRLADGKLLTAAAVVSNADLRRTFLELVDPSALPAAFRSAVAQAQPACSAFGVHLAIDMVPDVPPIVLVRPEEGPDVGIVLPSLADPSAAPAGYTTVEIETLLPHEEARQWFRGDTRDEWEAWRHSAEYAARKAEFGDRLLATAETAIRGLSRHIVWRADASPVTYGRFVRSSWGAVYGVTHGSRLTGAKSPIPGLLVAGSANAGAGIEAVMIAGAEAAEALVPGLLARAPVAPALWPTAASGRLDAVREPVEITR